MIRLVNGLRQSVGAVRQLHRSRAKLPLVQHRRKQLQPYADQLIFPVTADESTQSMEARSAWAQELTQWRGAFYDDTGAQRFERIADWYELGQRRAKLRRVVNADRRQAEPKLFTLVEG